MNIFCNHLYVCGFGCMGDGVVCANCGVDKYPEVAPGYALAVMLGRVVREKNPDYDEWVSKAQAAREARQAGGPRI